MERLITEQENQKEEITLQINPIGNLFADSPHIIELSVCGDPLCNCGAATMVIVKEENKGTTNIEYRIPIDVHKGVIRSRYHKKYYAKSENQDFVLDLLSNGLTSDDWYSLKNVYFDKKFIIGDQVDPDEINFEFEEEHYESESLMFYYHEAFPCSTFAQEIEGKKYLLFDLYCKNPTCQCGNMQLEVQEVVETNEGEKVGEFVGSYVYNYNTTISKIEGENKAEVTAIVQQVFDNYSDINNLFRRRNLVLRKMYARSKQAYTLKQLNQVKQTNKKVGRNELCPCGSGKKYKKCCMR